MLAAAEGKRGMLMLAMTAGARTELRLQQYTALHMAIRNHHHSCVHQLLAMKASAQTAGPKHMSPLVMACAIGSAESTRLLMAHGANPLWIDEDGFRAKDHASEHIEVKRALADFGFGTVCGWKCKMWFRKCCGCCKIDNHYLIQADNTPEAREATILGVNTTPAPHHCTSPLLHPHCTTTATTPVPPVTVCM